ncbi:DUF5694 domain-containing protein [Phenylobacterium sp.]|uniref:DUF5694 domain-containing protein n=1 Tax=Phenylobacterium sp. TaxID=1871053 RepID=UPI00120B52D4|nr:DUF5694 domain-containing protein [Phenylobacterium sp.]THD59347.1 MAG: hypothetical protein E8A49_16800 [Phenylobacterium sp.]
MGWKLLAAAFGSLALASQARAADPPASPPPVEVMVVGVFHMSNPGRDLHNLKVDDVLEPKRQGEIAAVTAALARFKPTKVGVEWPADVVAERYKQYLAGTLAPSRNEVVQLGFRLAKTAGSEGVYSLDADGDFPYERLQNFAETRGFKGLLDEQNAIIQRQVAEEARLLAEKGVAADLRFLNDPERIKADNGFYRAMLHIGLNSDQPGVDLLSAWYRRNLQICANLLQLAKPGDRVAVFFGSGHAFLLRQCVTETPGYKLVEANDYLPR